MVKEYNIKETIDKIINFYYLDTELIKYFIPNMYNLISDIFQDNLLNNIEFILNRNLRMNLNHF